MNVKHYLERIHYDGEIAVNLSVLRALQRQHLLNIPFENLDIIAHRRIELDLEKIYEKIIVNRRGGFCYELNGLFFGLLNAIGFNSKLISGRVFSSEGSYGEEYDHLAIITSVNGQDYLVDVGFGEFVFGPLKMVLDLRQQDERGEFMIDKLDESYFKVSKLKEGQAIPQYIFKAAARKLHEFDMMCQYHQTSPDSHFTSGRYISIPVINGRITVHRNILKVIKGEETCEQEIGEEDFDELLLRYFKFREENNRTRLNRR